MKNLVQIILLMCLIYSCSTKRKTQEWNTIVQSSSIKAYQNHIIENPKTKNLGATVDSLRLLWDRYNLKRLHIDCFGNCLTLIVDRENKLLFEGNSIQLKGLSQVIEMSLRNPECKQNLPEKKVKYIKGVGTVFVPNGIIDLVSHKNIDLKFYSKVIVEITSSFEKLRADYSRNLFKNNYETLNQKQKQIIDSIIPIGIRFERFAPGKLSIPSPPPKDNIVD